MCTTKPEETIESGENTSMFYTEENNDILIGWSMGVKLKH